MAFTKHTRPSADIDRDRQKIRFEIGLKLEGTVFAISPRQPSTFGGEVRYVDVDTTDGRKVSFGISKFKLEIFEEVGYQPGDGIRVEIVERETKPKDGTAPKKYAYPEFEIEKRGPRVDSQVSAPAASVVDDNPPF